MERRVLIALFLSFLVVFAYQALFPTTPRPKEATTAGQIVAPGEAPSATPAAGSAPAASTPLPAALVGAAQEETVSVDLANVVAVFTNRGGRLQSWKLKNYRDASGQPLELIDGNVPTLPFSLTVSDPATTNTLNSALFIARRSQESGSERVVFEFRSENGLVATKQFDLAPKGYTVSVRSQVTQNGQTLPVTIAWGPGLGDRDSQTTRSAVKPEALFSSANAVSRLAASKIQSQPTYDQEFDYVGIDDHYFAVFAVKPGHVKVTYESSQLPDLAKPSDPPHDRMAFSVQPASPDQTLTFYAGPKDFDALAAIDRNFVKAINFGMFSVIVVPLLRSLNWIHGYVGNYGWAIFILTLLINVVLFPLNHKSVVSMRKMQEIQPEAKAIQERYAKLKATDPSKQKMNQELMALYRENGVNPASGCLPMLLVLPVFLAFYSLLTTAIELRGAPFFGWIHDLSLPDPFYVMPVLVGATQILQQWMTPQAGVDPAQQKMMMIMPVVLIFVFVQTPSGALIYWLVGNVWRIAQMKLTNYLHPPKVHVVRPAAERRVKRPVQPVKADE